MILIGAVCSALIDLAHFAPRIGAVAALVGASYFGAFYLSIVGATMTDNDDLPDWPSVTEFAGDLFAPLLRLLGLGLISFGPAFLGLLLHDPESASSWIPMALGVAWGCFYFPMALIAAEARGGLVAALPHIVLPAIVRIFPHYIGAVASMGGIFGLLLLEEFLLSDIPYLGWFLAGVVALYGQMFQGRLTGLIYRHHGEKLGW